MAEGKLDYRAINVLDASFRFRVKPLETDFLFADGSVKTFTNWDIKGVRERFYMEEYVSVPVEEYLRAASATGEIVEHGIKVSDVRKFVEEKTEFFEDLLLEAASNVPLDGDEPLAEELCCKAGG
jgi:hypothetical protein